LVERDEVLTVLPGTLPPDELARRLAATDAAAVMKLGRTYDGVRTELEESGRLGEAFYVERASTDRERSAPLADVDPDSVPYFAVGIVPSRVHAATTEQARAAFESRLMALSRAHDVLTRENWEGAGLREIVKQALEPYSNRREDRLHLSGRDIRLVPRSALALAMAFQELATNAVKYGALSNGAGEIDIAWKLDRKAEPPRLRLRWEERGGPPVSPPLRRGFGSRLIERSLAHDLDGVVGLEFAPGGVVCTIDAPVG
jgi:two-component sensor histidine kinase